MNTPSLCLSLALSSLALAACTTATPASEAAPGHAHAHAMGPMAVATLGPTQGQAARGIVMFHEMDGHLMAHARLTGLAPNSEHGFHVHEQGTCASTDGSSAGGHFNPTNQPHGAQDAAHHAGDLPSLKADADGNVDQKLMLDGPTLGAGPTSLIGRSVIVHANPDDYSSQPAGNAGPRIACGVIAAAMH